MLNRDAILGHKDTRIQKVLVEEFGGEVCIAALTAAEADRLRQAGESPLPFTVQVVILGACDEDGQRLFSDKDGAALAKLPASALGRIAQAILRHNALTEDSQDAAKNA